VVRIAYVVPLGLALLGACAVSNNSEEGDPAQESGTIVSTSAARQEPRRYTIQAIPTETPSDRSEASKAICERHEVVGYATHQMLGTQNGVVFDGTTLTEVPTLGGRSGGANGGNASGAVVGASVPANGFTSHAFIYRDGAVQDLGTLGGAFSSASAINDNDQIVGQSTLIRGGDVPSHATLWEAGQIVDLGTLGGAESFARGINNAGVIIGVSSNVEDPSGGHAVVWRDRVIEALDDAGSKHSQPHAINASGTIAGAMVAFNGAPWRAVVWDHGAGTPTELGTLGSSSYALGINERGDVVGMAWDAAGTRPRPFLYAKHDELRDLEPLVDNSNGWVLLQATDICNDGMIVGNGWLDGANRGFVLTPVK
jgi:probable HAF family extracellular repeat protein